MRRLSAAGRGPTTGEVPGIRSPRTHPRRRPGAGGGPVARRQPTSEKPLTATLFKYSIERVKATAHRQFKDELFRQLARVTKALSSARRLELVDLLAQGERRVEDLAELTGMSVANTSQHLQALRGALLVDVRREGQRAYYRLADDAVFRTWQAIRDLGQRQFAEVDRLLETYVAERGRLESVSAAELLRRLRGDQVVVLDVRPAVEYQAGHILGARSVPVKELQRRLAELPKRREIVAYCRGPFCVYADEAVALLRRRGYRARRLEGGFPDWKTAGLPVGTNEVERA
jgi:rhodanese-related sulfurtransferase